MHNNIAHQHNNILFGVSIIEGRDDAVSRANAQRRWRCAGRFDFPENTKRSRRRICDIIYVYIWVRTCVWGEVVNERSPPGVVRVPYELKTIRFLLFSVVTIIINYNITVGVTRIRWSQEPQEKIKTQKNRWGAKFPTSYHEWQ